MSSGLFLRRNTTIRVVLHVSRRKSMKVGADTIASGAETAATIWWWVPAEASHDQMSQLYEEQSRGHSPLHSLRRANGGSRLVDQAPGRPWKPQIAPHPPDIQVGTTSWALLSGQGHTPDGIDA